MAKSTGKLYHHFDAQFDILPFLKGKQTNSQESVLSKLLVNINFISDNLDLISKIAQLDRDEIILEIANNVDWFKQNFNFNINVVPKFKKQSFNRRFNHLLFKENRILNNTKKTSKFLQDIHLMSSDNYQNKGLKEEKIQTGAIAPLFIVENNDEINLALYNYFDKVDANFNINYIFSEINSIDLLSKLLNLDNPFNYLILNGNYHRHHNPIDVTLTPVFQYHFSYYSLKYFHKDWRWFSSPRYKYIDGTINDRDFGSYYKNNFLYKIINNLIKLGLQKTVKKFQIKNFKLIACFITVNDDADNSGYYTYSLQFIWQGEVMNMDTLKTMDNYVNGKLFGKYIQDLL